MRISFVRCRRDDREIVINKKASGCWLFGTNFFLLLFLSKSWIMRQEEDEENGPPNSSLQKREFEISFSGFD